jgi:HEAT repeat protein
VVTLNRRLGFFSESPAYYFILRRYVRAHYSLAARFGRYDVLRRGAADGPPVTASEPVLDGQSPERVLAQLQDPDREGRRQAVRAFLARAGTAAGVETLAQDWTPDEGRRLLLIRNLGESGDERAVDLFVRTYDTGSARLRAEAAFALTQFAIRDVNDRYLLAPDAALPSDRSLVASANLPLARLRGWMENPVQRDLVGGFAARALATAEDASAPAVLEAVLDEERKRVFRERVYFRVASAEALVRLGHPAYLCELVSLLGKQKHEVQDTVPSFLLEAARLFPGEVSDCLARGLAAPLPLAREVSAWVAGAIGDPAVAPALQGALGDPAVAVRIAAVWALGALRVAAARPALEDLAGDEDPHLRAFAREALDRIAGVVS